MPRFLPQELEDRIVNNLAPDRIAVPSEHYADLRACALTCQSWLPRAQCELYKHVQLNRLESMELFARTLEQSTTLRGLVQHLDFRFTVEDWEEPASVKEVPFPPNLIASLGALQGLRLECSTVRTVLQIEFMKEWTACTQLRTLQVSGFFFEGLEDLTRVIWSLPLLEELCISQTGWEAVGRETDPADFPGHCQRLTTVEMLEVSRDDDLLPLLGTAIQKLSIAWMWYTQSEDTYAAVSTLSELRTLELSVNILDYPWMTPIFAQVRSVHLRELVIRLVLLDQDVGSRQLGLLFSREDFDDLLSRKPLDRVNRVKIVTETDKAGDSAEPWLREVQAVLPRFLKRGTVEVEVVHVRYQTA